mgnify:CR=1 FL=1
MSEGLFTVVFIIASLAGIFLSLYLGSKGIYPEQIGREAYRQDNPSDSDKTDS